MNEMEAIIVVSIIMGFFTGTGVKFAHGVKTGEIVMKRPPLSAIAEGLGIKMNRKTTGVPRLHLWNPITEWTHRRLYPNADTGRPNAHPPDDTVLRWIDMVLYHGFEKTLRGVINKLRNGGWWTRSDNGWYWKIEKGNVTIENIPQHIGQALEYIKMKLECGCSTNPHEGIASCSEIINHTIAELVQKYGVYDLPRLAVMQYPSLHTMTQEHIEAAVRIEREYVFTECCGELPTTRRYAGGSPQVVYCDKCDRELYDDIGC